MKGTTHGAFAQDKVNSWRIDTKVKVNNEWKHFVKRGYRTLSDAKQDYERAYNEFVKEHTKHHEIMTFDDLITEYKKYRSYKVNATTLYGDESIFKIYLGCFNGQLLKNCLNKESLENWYSLLVNNKKLSENRKSKVITRVRDIIDFAYNHKYIDAETKQDCDIAIVQVKNSKQAKTERVVWTNEEEDEFFNAINDCANDKDYMMFKLLLVAGLRIGELQGLQVKCYDPKANTIEIKQQVVTLKGGSQLTDILKTHESYRTIVLTEKLCNMLDTYINTFKLSDDDFIFFTENQKRPISKTEIRRKLYRYCDIAGIRRANPHALRHNQAVKLASVCETMEDIENAAKRLGHSPSMFANTYANHTNAEAQRDLLKRIYG